MSVAESGCGGVGQHERWGHNLMNLMRLGGTRWRRAGHKEAVAPTRRT